MMMDDILIEDLKDMDFITSKKRQRQSSNKIIKLDNNVDNQFKHPDSIKTKRRKLNENDLKNSNKIRTNLNNSKTDNNESYLIKFSPKSKNDLCIDKKKLLLIENWFQSVYEQKDLSERVFVLYGPTGSAKTTTIKLLAEFYDVKLIEFEEKTQTYCKTEDEKKHLEYIGKQLTQLENFVSIANSALSKKERDRRKAILIKDIPSTFQKEPKLLHQFLLNYLKLFKKGAPIIFIITINDSMTINELKKLFPLELENQLGLNLIELNSVIKRQIKAVLETINSIGLVPKKDLDYLIESANGDIRSAINALEFMVKSNHDLFENEFEIYNHKNKIESATNIHLTKDMSPTFFHMLGKIMYCKRDGDEQQSTKNSKSINKISSAKKSSSLNNSLIDQSNHNERRKLKEIPEEIVNSIGSSGDLLNAFIHECYLDFVDDNLTNATELITNLCFIDSNFSDSFQYAEFEDYMKLLAVRGTMFNLNTNLKPIQKKKQFKSFNRPLLFKIQQDQDKFKNRIKEISNKDEYKFRTKEELFDILTFKDKNLYSKLN